MWWRHNVSTDPNSDVQPDRADSPGRKDERASNVGWGIGLLAAGMLMAAQQFGWAEDVNWFVPALLLGLGGSYLYKAFTRG